MNSHLQVDQNGGYCLPTAVFRINRKATLSRSVTALNIPIRASRTITVIAFVTHMFAPSALSGGERTGGPMKIEASLTGELRANRDAARKFAVIVSFKDKSGAELVRRLGVEPTAVYQNITAAAAELTAAQIEALALEPEVTAIEPDQPAEALGAP